MPTGVRTALPSSPPPCWVHETTVDEGRFAGEVEIEPMHDEIDPVSLT